MGRPRNDAQLESSSAIAEQTDASPGAQHDSVLRARRPARIVLAEDDDNMRELLALALRLDGHDVRLASNGWQLIEQLEKLESQGLDPQLIITDVRMPGVTGLEAMAALDGPRWSVPFIVISAFGGADIHDRAFRLGAAAFLDKPFKLEALRETVRSILSASRPRDARPGDTTE